MAEERASLLREERGDAAADARATAAALKTALTEAEARAREALKKEMAMAAQLSAAKVSCGLWPVVHEARLLSWAFHVIL